LRLSLIQAASQRAIRARGAREGLVCDAVDIVCVGDLTSDYLVAVGAVFPLVRDTSGIAHTRCVPASSRHLRYRSYAL